jgi:hypothetical protein
MKYLEEFLENSKNYKMVICYSVEFVGQGQKRQRALLANTCRV